MDIKNELFEITNQALAKKDRILSGLITKGLKLKGFSFDSEDERNAFIIEHGRRVVNSSGDSTFYVKNKPFLFIKDSTFDFKKEGYSASMVVKYSFV